MTRNERAMLTPPAQLAQSGPSAVHETMRFGKLLPACTVHWSTSPRWMSSCLQMLSKYRPACPILTLTPDPATARRCQIMRGVQVSQFKPSELRDQSLEQMAVGKALELGMVHPGDKMVLVVPGTMAMQGQSNMMKMIKVPEDADALSNGGPMMIMASPSFAA